MTAPTGNARHPQALTCALQLDGLLFAARGWFVIDQTNHKVRGVTPGTLDQALALVGRGPIATFVGQLRPEVLAVDIDATGALGDLAAHTLRDWCADRGLWHLLRASGGGPGHWHLLAVPGVHRDALVDVIDQLRRELRLGSQRLDRTRLRPLSAPHRTGRSVSPPERLDEALEALRVVLEPLPAGTQARRADRHRPPRTQAGRPAEPLTPLHRPRRDLPAPWAAYLDRGRAAATAVDRDPHSRSQLELEATTQLVLAGYSEPDAWAVITTAHHTAFTKARTNGRAWWCWVWNRCVLDADTWLSTRRRDTPPTAAPQASTQRARAELEATWRSWPARTRHTDREVLTVVLDRLDRVQATAVPIPQRDLVLDCAVASRTTVREALRRLQDGRWLHVDATYQPGSTDTAHTLRVHDRFTTPTAAEQSDPDHHNSSAVSVNDPSRYQPPQPASLPQRRALGLAVSAALAHLPDAGATAGIDLAQLSYTAGFLAPGQTTPSSRQLRTIRGHLQTLGRYGLAQVDQYGQWRATTPLEQQAGNVLERVGHTLDATVRNRVADERAEFRVTIDPVARRARWEAQRHAALAQAAKLARNRQKGWWEHLNPEQRQQRRAALTTAFTILPVAKQAERKQQLAQQRARAGENEPDRHTTWLRQLDPDDLAQRSTDRAITYVRRPAHEQQQLVAAWTEHRARWQLPHHQRPRTAAAATNTPELPEAAFLTRQPPTVEKLVLFDAAHLATTPRQAQQA